jgi:hypothetical protein
VTRRVLASAAAIAALLIGGPGAGAQDPGWSREPWLQDLEAARAAVDSKYLEWLLSEREVDLDALFGRARSALMSARSDADARAVFDRLVQRFGDGHVGISWPRPAPAPAPAAMAAAPPAPPPTAHGFCRARGYGNATPGLAPALSGYAPIESGDLLPAGTIEAAGAKIGLLRIGVFDPHGSLSLCTEAVAALGIPLDAPCDDACDNRIVTRAYERLNAAIPSSSSTSPAMAAARNGPRPRHGW